MQGEGFWACVDLTPTGISKEPFNSLLGLAESTIWDCVKNNGHDISFSG